MNVKTFKIKNMVCARCIASVQDILIQNDVSSISLDLGEVTIDKDLEDQKLETIKTQLENIGFEIISDRKSQLIENIKRLIIQEIHHSEHYNTEIQWSYFLSEKLNYEYNYLSSLFSSTSGITLEQFIIRQKLEKVKELLCYDELSLKEITYKLGYSSVAHLSGQFKKVIGMTPTKFKNHHRAHKIRSNIDQILK